MLRKTILLLVLSCSLTYGQQPVPLGLSLFLPSINSTADSTNYCFHVSQLGPIAWYTWDNIYLVNQSGTSNTLFPPQWGTPEVLQFLNGELHVASNFRFWGIWEDRSYLSKYSNGNWVLIDSLKGYIDAGVMHQGSMYYGGFINDTARQFRSVVRYKNGVFSQVGQLSGLDSIYSLQSHGGQLWASGRFSLSQPSDTAHLMIYDTSSNTWSMPIKEVPGFNPGLNPIFNGFRTGFHYANKSYLIRDSTIYEVRNDSLIFRYQLPLGRSNHRWYKMKVVHLNGKIYINSDKYIVEFNGTTFKAVNLGLDGYPASTILPFGNEIYGSVNSWWPNIGGIKYDYTFRWDPQAPSGSGTVLGTAYFDQNRNCLRDSAESREIAFNLILRNLQTGDRFLCAYQENYSIVLPPGLYKVDSVRAVKRGYESLLWEANCYGDTFSIDTSGTPSKLDFPFQHNGLQDYGVSINLFSNRFRQGFTEGALLSVQNLSDQNLTSAFTAEVIIPPTLLYKSSSIIPSQIKGDTLRFSFQGLDALSDSSLVLGLEVLMVNNIWDSIYVQARLLSPGDSFISNNFDTICAPVVGAYDPNDKTPSLEESSPGLRQLEYHIRFQNTGTDTAYTVVVRDTLEPYFDPFSIELGASSHPFQYELVDENILVWTFNNILLPDSSTDPLSSQGFFTFHIDVDPSLTAGSVIDNDAEIYFDFQPPIHTNHAQTLIVSELSLKEDLGQSLQVYPNPIQQNLQVVSDNDIKQAYLFDVYGRQVRFWQFNKPLKNMTLDFSDLPTGSYILQIGTSKIKVLKLD